MGADWGGAGNKESRCWEVKNNDRKSPGEPTTASGERRRERWRERRGRYWTQQKKKLISKEKSMDFKEVLVIIYFITEYREVMSWNPQHLSTALLPIWLELSSISTLLHRTALVLPPCVTEFYVAFLEAAAHGDSSFPKPWSPCGCIHHSSMMPYNLMAWRSCTVKRFPTQGSGLFPWYAQ